MRGSLFEASGEPTIARSWEWMSGLATGSVTLGFGVLAIAFAGLAMMTGRFDVRRGAAVVLGCFFLFGANFIATSLIGSSGSPSNNHHPEHQSTEVNGNRGTPPPPSPYRGVTER